MSRGLGVIERAIACDIARPDRAGEPYTVQVSSWDLLCNVYRDLVVDYEFTLAQRKAVTRAMHTFVRKYPRYALAGGQGRTLLYLYEPADPLSALWAKLQVANRKRNPVPRCEAQARLQDAAA